MPSMGSSAHDGFINVSRQRSDLNYLVGKGELLKDFEKGYSVIKFGSRKTPLVGLWGINWKAARLGTRMLLPS